MEENYNNITIVDFYYKEDQRQWNDIFKRLSEKLKAVNTEPYNQKIYTNIFQFPKCKTYINIYNIYKYIYMIYIYSDKICFYNQCLRKFFSLKELITNGK